MANGCDSKMKQNLVATSLLYAKGAKIWIPDGENVWECAEISVDYDGKSLQAITQSGQKHVITTLNADDLPPLRNPDILIGENDLTSLSYLHEPAVLYNLLVRFCHKYSIYTYCGIVLVAINPYQELQIYGNDTISAYRGRAMGELDPHIFAIAEEAYTRIESEKRDQSIIVSGESGAGKTVSAKYAMRYFATVSGSAKETQVERKVLASSPIMEAIGNAKTTRNDNSSRFGKFIELQFNRHFQIVGASMRTYLLEKSRVVFQATRERNYHIFYQLCSSKEKYPELKLEPPENYKYLHSECDISGVDDGKTFAETMSACETLGFTEAEQADIRRILAGILHLGNVEIMEKGHQGSDSEATFITDNDAYLMNLCKLLNLDVKNLAFSLCHRRIISTKEVFNKPMTSIQASNARDALAKHVYAKLFSWIVKTINKTLESSSSDKYRFIGVLDIYGFETFDINSFEQFCINYANEKLQQQFNLHVFKLDQEEYTKENIEWKFIDFYDNQPCIDLIETKLGVLDLLDEECRMPKGTDESWCMKLCSKCTQWQHFEKPRFGASSFIIRHFADKVEYQCADFLEKNRDTVIEEQVMVLRCSGNAFVRKLFGESEDTLNVSNRAATIGHYGKTRLSPAVKSASSTAGAAVKQHKKTVGSQFRESLNALMATLNATTPHYIRCIKPNDDKLPFVYNAQRAVQQLRACGVLETIRISAAGFPSRILYTDFHARYKILCPGMQLRNNCEKACEFVLSNFIKDEDKYKHGKTKIFFRAGQVAYLERLRSEKLKNSCLLMQKTVRGFLARRKYRKIIRATRLLQRLTRGFIARRRVRAMRRERASMMIQKNVRRWLQRKKYQSIRRSVLNIQVRGRGLLARKNCYNMKRNKAATTIQSNVKMWLVKMAYKRDVKKIIKCQCYVRRFLAKKRFKQLKREARSMEHMKKLHKGLENKIISLQQKIEELKKENVVGVSALEEMKELRMKLEGMKALDSEVKNLRAILNEKDLELKGTKALVQVESERNRRIVVEREEAFKLLQEQKEEYEKERRQFLEARAKEKENLPNLEKMIEERIQREKMLIMREEDRGMEAYQNLLCEKNALETRVEILEHELAKVTDDRRSPSNASSNSHGSPTGASNHLPLDKSDIGLVLKLQQKLKMVEMERDKLCKLVDDGGDHPASGTCFSYDRYNERAKEALKWQEVQAENRKLVESLEKLRQSVAASAYAEDNAVNELMSQFRDMDVELRGKKEECDQLRAALEEARQTPFHFKAAEEDGGELAPAFEALKKINRQLEEELQRERENYREMEQEMRRLKEDNEKQLLILSRNLESPHLRCEAFVEAEIARVISENLDLREKKDKKILECKWLKNQLEEHLKSCGASGAISSSVVAVPGKESPAVRKKEGAAYAGMFEFEKEDVPAILKILVTDLQPSTAIKLLPGLPAYIIFMCIRDTDAKNDDERVRILLGNFINTVKKTVKRRINDVETCVLWMCNTLRLLHTLKQYSGDAMFQEENTPAQNAQCLQHFDLFEYRKVLSDSGVQIYQYTVLTMQDKIQKLALSAILEYEAIPGLSGGNQLKKRSQSVSSGAGTTMQDNGTPDDLQKRLSSYFNTMCYFGLDPQLITQMFKQLFYFICATSMNNLLLRKELCHWSKGMQIRFNLSHLEQWARDQTQLPELQEGNVLDMLLPIIQASQLLQARKSDQDVDVICEMCNCMTSHQIIKLLNLYTPGDDYEEKVTMDFIKKVQAKLAEREENPAQASLLMDTKFVYPVRFPFNPSNIRLEDIEIPDCLNLPMLRKV